MTTLIIFTEVYPFSVVAESFLYLEIIHLSPFFEKIIIVPTLVSKSTERTDRKHPDNVFIDTTYCQKTNAHQIHNNIIRILTHFFSAMNTKDFYREVAENFPSILHSLPLTTLRDHIYNALEIEKWTLDYIKMNNVDLSNTYFYTYYLSNATTGIAFAKKKYPGINLISRAHGWDLYLERYTPPYIPFRPKIFQFLNKVFLVSKDGKNYFLKKYPAFIEKFDVSFLGVNDPGFITRTSQDNIYRIVSCSRLDRVKRIELLIQGLKELGEMRKNCHFLWTHIGDGLLKKDLEESAGKILPRNIKYNFLGFLANEEVINYYKNNPVDVFINVSKFEGIPVTIMEVQSCGIPAIATNVGGTSEIVSDKEGILLNANPNPSEIASALCKMMDDPIAYQKKKQNSRKNWEIRYNAERNYALFAKQLKEK